MTTFSGPGELAADLGVEHRPEGDELVDTTRPFVDEHPHGSTSHSPAPAARVSARWRSVESSSPPTTAATPPWAQRVADWARSPLVRTPTLRPAGVGQAYHRRQPRHAAAEDEDVEFHEWRPDGPGAGLNPRRPGVSASSSAARPRSMTALAASTWTTVGRKPTSSADS